jgi:hypothetical protein
VIKAPRITMKGMERELLEAGYKIKEKCFLAESLYMIIAQKK